MLRSLRVILVILMSGVLSYEPVTKPVIVPEYIPSQLTTIPLAEEQNGPYEHLAPHRKYKYLSYQPYCDSRKAPECDLDPSGTFCLNDPNYPYNDVRVALADDLLLAKRYADRKDQSADDLVNDIGQIRENLFDYSFYKGDSYSKSNWMGNEGYICPSHVEYARPLRAKNVRDEWRVIVNDPSHLTQTQRLETCLYPNVACRTLAPCYFSRCVQKYVHHRMLSYDPCYPQKGVFIDVYKLPSTCSCHIPLHT